MSEQTNAPVNTSKPDRSANYVVSRLSYDCLISSTKSFIHNFNFLSDEEKLEFKSLTTYVKQLEKCLPSKQNRQVSKPKKVVVQLVESQEPLLPIEEKVVEPVQTKGNKRTKKVETMKEVSPTAVAVAVAAEVASTVVETLKEESKKPVTKKSTQSKTK